MKEIKIDIREWNRWLKDQFYNKDLITFEELINKFEDIVLENERLQKEIKNKDNRISELLHEIKLYEGDC